MNVVLLRAGVDDAARLGALHSAGWRAAYAGIATEDFLRSFSPEARTAYFQRILLVTANEHYLICVDGEDAGMMALGASADVDAHGRPCGELIALYLLPAHWGCGIGSKAMHFALSRLGELGCGDTLLEVLSENERAIRFYSKFGFVPDSPEEPFDMGRPVMERKYRLPRA